MSDRYGRTRLPVFQLRAELVDAVAAHNLLVIIGETGSGKTTQIPQYILESLPNCQRIVVTQPRRIAAISVARRVAAEQNVRLGKAVGYRVRFDDCTTPGATRLQYVTDGLLLREACCHDDDGGRDAAAITAATHLAARYDVVIIDEAHERTVDTDILFGVLKQIHTQQPKLKIIVMSATLNVEKFSDFFYNCPIFTIPGRTYPVQLLHHRDSPLAALHSSFVSRALETTVHIHHSYPPPGDILVFLTGREDIERACRTWADMEAAAEVESGAVVYPIYGALETIEQRAVFEPTPNRMRKIVFATNIAQTSITIPGIRYVIDSGFVKQKVYDPKSGMDALVIVPISKAAATQRAGRAGRTEPGIAYRLYSRAAYDQLVTDTVPEIQRISLASTILSLKQLDIRDLSAFPFLDAPPRDLLVSALRNLHRLGAIGDTAQITKLGNQMASLPLSPVLSRTLLAAANLPAAPAVLTIVAMLAAGDDPYITPRSDSKRVSANRARAKFAHSSGDHMTLWRVYEAWREAGYDRDWCWRNYLHARVLASAKNIREQLHAAMTRHDLIQRHGDTEPDDRELTVSVLKAFCTAYTVGSLAKRAPHRRVFYHIGDTGTDPDSTLLALHLSPTSIFTADSDIANIDQLEWVVYHGVTHTGGKAVMRCVSCVEPAWVRRLERRVPSDDVLLEGRQEVVKVEDSAGVTEVVDVPVNHEEEKRLREEKLQELRERYNKRRGV